MALRKFLEYDDRVSIKLQKNCFSYNKIYKKIGIVIQIRTTKKPRRKIKIPFLVKTSLAFVVKFSELRLKKSLKNKIIPVGKPNKLTNKKR